MYSLSLNNLPHIGFTLFRVAHQKNMTQQTGELSMYCNMAGTGIHTLAKRRAQILLFDRTRITSWQTALKRTADCQASRSGSKESMRRHLKFRPLYVAIRSTHLSAMLSKWAKSSSHNFTSRVPLFEMSLLFDGRLFRCESGTHRIV
jgi:hypothetical protein